MAIDSDIDPRLTVLISHSNVVICPAAAIGLLSHPRPQGKLDDDDDDITKDSGGPGIAARERQISRSA
jgi:hypothetical protein